MHPDADAVQAALDTVERTLAALEATRGRTETLPMPAAVPLAMRADGALDTLEALGVCPPDRISALRERLTALGLERSAGTASGGAVGVVDSGPSAHDQLDDLRRRFQAPTDESPTVLPLAVELGRSDTVVVVLVEAQVFDAGAQLVVWTHGRGDHPSFLPTHPAFAARLGRPAATEPDFEVRFDGRTGRAVSRMQLHGSGFPTVDGILLLSDGGNGNDRLLRRSYWLTPRPGGEMTIGFAWPEQGLARADHTVDLGAPTRSHRVWP